MQAIVYHCYGPPDVLRCEEIEKPIPGDGQVLVRVRAASANPIDWHFMRGTPYFIRMMAGVTGPKNPRLGTDLAGQVEAIGRGVERLKPGDAVFGASQGAFAEYVCAAEAAFAAKPDRLTFEQAASLPVAAITALQVLRDRAHVQPGRTVLINGAAGGVGTFAVQIAKAFGAEVTGVCSTPNVALVRSIGSDHVVDYTRENFTSSGRRYDLIIDCIGNHPLAAIRRTLNPTGTYVAVGGSGGRWAGPLPRAIGACILSWFSAQQFSLHLAKLTLADLEALRDLVTAGKLTPVIDRSYRLEQVPEAIRYLEQSHARGKVVIAISQGAAASSAG